jgi:hypothetical protein
LWGAPGARAGAEEESDDGAGAGMAGEDTTTDKTIKAR